ncbi:uncharacterized protein LOC119071866 [Bradysia coprophila]|uniref:uncharacterized protein LOC119071866 n=1 Tax=Bradysia coprophila TaxID=38358 RepID=UPI00187DBEAB|nr:uncharacterized protein LOC119071866 [Bradysia coprophila]
MVWFLEMCQSYLFRAIGYAFSTALANLCFKCSYELFYEYRNITLSSSGMSGVFWMLLRRKFGNNFQTFFLFGMVTLLLASSELKPTISKSDCGIVFLTTFLMLIVSAVTKHNQLEDGYKYFIRYSGLDCGSFMAYSFFHGYIKYVVASNGDTSSKDLKERMTDYEAKHQVSFPIKKLLILQPQSMHIPPTFRSDRLQDAENLEEVLINRGGVVNRRYQLSVYKLVGTDYYVNVQGASPLLTYYEESERSELLAKYKTEVSMSFRKHLEKLINDDLSCRGLVEVIYYKDWDEIKQKPVDISEMLLDYIEKNR